MKLSATGAVVVVATGLVVGGLAGSALFEQIDDHRPVCASCHHGTISLDQVDETPPHSTDFDAGCHGCHVLPVQQYLERGFATTGLGIPAWVEGVDNPVIGGQTCLECHLARGRGIIACEQCHVEGTLEVRLDQECEACHEERIPLHPHTDQACLDCHPEVYLDPHGRSERLMQEKLGLHHPGGTP